MNWTERDPLEGVDFPRETRNPRKRDRDRIRFAMRCADMDRGPFKSQNGFRSDLSPRMRAVHLNRTRYHRLNLSCANSAVRRADLLRTWRIVIGEARECVRPRLP